MKNRFILVVFASLLAAAVLKAQVQQANNWHFGDKISISFASGAPVLNPPSEMQAFEGIVSMSDTSGQLLFYTNGGGRPFDESQPAGFFQNPGIIWNRNHEVMYDMRGEEGGGFSARQSAIAMPDPAGEEGVYYLFTMEESEFDVGGSVPDQPLGRGLSYFIIDMNLNGGLGGVRLADQRVYTPAYEALDATPMANEDGYWIMCHNNFVNGPKFVIVPLTAAGVGTPLEIPMERASGKIEFSPNGRFMFNDRKVYNFDNATGILASDPVELPNVSSQASCFTPDSRYLYTTQNFPVLGELIVRYDLQDLSAPPLTVERLEVALGENVFVTAPFQIGPNGNIYFLEQAIRPGELTRFGMSEIVCVSGENPTVNRNIIPLPNDDATGFFAQYLPQFVDAIFAVEPRPDTTRLDTLPVITCNNSQATLSARESDVSYRWSTGDTTATITVAEAGLYCVTITGGSCFPTVDCQSVTNELTGISPEAFAEEDLGCEGRSCTVDLNVAAAFTSIKVSLFQTNPLGTPILVAEFLSVTDTVNLIKPEDGQQYEIEVTYENCGQIDHPLLIDFPADNRFRPQLGFSSEGEICDGRDVTLEVTNPGSLEIDFVRYEDGNTDNPRTLPAAFETEIPVTVFSVCGDSVNLVFDEPVAEFCLCKGEVPELISPNNDNVNDEFRLYSNCPAEDYTLLIFNRWGQRVFESTNPEQAWDGTVSGTPQNSDVYLYRMVFRFPNMEEVEVREGAFNLIR